LSFRALDAVGSLQMRRQCIAIVLLILLCTFSSPIDAKERKQKRRHVKAVAKHLSKQLAKVQHQTSKKAAKITSTMSYSAAVGFCSEKIKAMSAAGGESTTGTRRGNPVTSQQQQQQ
jgi:hypothetical protein